MEETRIRILLIEDDGEYALLVRTLLLGPGHGDYELTVARSLAEGLNEIRAQAPDLIITDLSLPDSSGYSTFERIFEAANARPIVVLTGTDDDGMALRAVADGAQDYLVKDQLHAKTLVRSISYAIRRAKAERDQGSRAPAATGKVIGLIGAKGGVGTTTIALNVAAALALSDKSAIAAELTSSGGTFSQYLPKITARHSGKIDVNTVEGCLVKHASGLRILPGVNLSEDATRAVVRRLAALADFVVLDISWYPPEVAAAALRECATIGLVVDREPSSVLCARAAVERLEDMKINLRAVGAVAVSRTALDVPLGLAAMTVKMGCELLGIIPPAAQLCALALDYKTPLVCLRPDELVCSTYTDLAERLAAPAMIPVAV